MVDRRRIVRQWNAGGAQALVTLVRVEGSSYRRPGAHLLIGAGSECAGSDQRRVPGVGGGAQGSVDGARRRGGGALFDAIRHTAEIPFGLGCGGVVDLLLEPADTAECRALVEAMDASLGGSEARVATWFPASGRPLRRAVIGADGAVVFRSEGLNAGDLDAISHHSRAPVECTSEVYVETLAAPQRLFVLGAGEDAKPLATMASLLGWSVTVADGRAQLARAERFAEAERVLATASVAELEVGRRMRWL